PPIAFYLLPRGLPKTVYAGTLMAFFIIGNTAKLGLYIWLRGHDPAILWKVAVLIPAVPPGVWLGRYLHDRIAEPRLYLMCYLLVAVTGLKLLYDSLRSLLLM